MDDKLYAQMFVLEPTKSQRRRLQIVETAIECFSKYGFENTTYERIAAACKVTRPLIIHYFPEKDSLLLMVITYIRANLQNFAVAAIRKETTTENQLRAYVESTFDWVKDFPAHAQTWLLFYYNASIRSDLKELNSELVNTGHERIFTLLTKAHSEKKLAKAPSMEQAKMIQNLVTGSLLSMLTEKSLLSQAALRRSTIEFVAELAGLTSKKNK
ncbi:MAG: TetR/AcrR family transcriptional regulator [Bdellovibrionia bacterium]